MWLNLPLDSNFLVCQHNARTVYLLSIHADGGADNSTRPYWKVLPEPRLFFQAPGNSQIILPILVLGKDRVARHEQEHSLYFLCVDYLSPSQHRYAHCTESSLSRLFFCQANPCHPSPPANCLL